MNRIYRTTLAVAGLIAAGAGCDPQGEAPMVETAAAEGRTAEMAGGPTPAIMEVTATDFYFQAPSSIRAGLTPIQLVNDGPELHHVQLVRIDDGHTLHELLGRVAAGDLTPEWVTYVGGPNTPAPGERSEATLNLAPGQYAMLCLIPSLDGVPHLMKGMILPLTVTSGLPADPAEPRADVRMVLDDYSYGVSGQIRAGSQTIKVENKAAQPHEVLLVHLAPGKSAHDMVRWIENPHGPPPGKPIGGTTLLSRGEVNFVTSQFGPGQYALLCLVPDAGDGRPHIAHGMIQEFTVE